MNDDQIEDFSKSDVIMGEQMAICVYINQVDDTVIRQINNYPDDDSFVYIRPENIPALIRKLNDIYNSSLTAGDEV